MKTLIYRFTRRNGSQSEKQIDITNDDQIAVDFDRDSKAAVKTLRQVIPKGARLDYVALLPYKIPRLRYFKRIRLKGQLFHEC